MKYAAGLAAVGGAAYFTVATGNPAPLFALGGAAAPNVVGGSGVARGPKRGINESLADWRAKAQSDFLSKKF